MDHEELKESIAQRWMKDWKSGKLIQVTIIESNEDYLYVFGREKTVWKGDLFETKLKLIDRLLDSEKSLKASCEKEIIRLDELKKEALKEAKDARDAETA